MKKIIILFISIFLVSFCFVSCNSTKYNEALELIENGEYVAAYEILDELGDYKDAQQKIENFHYVPVRVTCSEEDEITYFEFFYNKDNLPSQVVYTYSYGDKFIEDYTYDANGNVIKEVYTDSDGDKSIYDYTYDANGNVIKEVYTYSDGDKSIYDYTYDANGNVIKEVHTDSDGDTNSVDIEYKLVYIPFGATEWIEEMLDNHYWW